MIASFFVFVFFVLFFSGKLIFVYFRILNSQDSMSEIIPARVESPTCILNVTVEKL